MKKPSWKPNIKKSWKVLKKKSQVLPIYSNRPWDLNPEKQHLQLNLYRCLQLPFNPYVPPESQQARYFQFVQLTYPTRMLSTIDFTIKES
jgi:hypothetical protein